MKRDKYDSTLIQSVTRSVLQTDDCGWKGTLQSFSTSLATKKGKGGSCSHKPNYLSASTESLDYLIDVDAYFFTPEYPATFHSAKIKKHTRRPHQTNILDDATRTLSDEEKEHIVHLKESLSLMQSKPLPYLLPAAFSALQETTVLEEALQILSLQELNEEAIKVVCTAFVREELSYMRCLVFISGVLLPIMQNLLTPASRTLMATLSHCARLHPKPILYGLLLPLSELQDIGTSQGEVVKRLIKDAYSEIPEFCVLYLKGILAQKEVRWVEVLVGILQNIINMSLQLDEEVGGLIVTQAGIQVGHMGSNLKFTTLVYTFISKYPTLAKPHIAILEQILSKCQNYMAKSALTKLGTIS